jgi:hypothetical protein
MTAKKRRASKAAAPKVAAAAKADVVKKTRARRKTRPTEYSTALANRIVKKLSDGQGLNHICKSPAMPAESTVRSWVVDDVEGFAAKYARGRDIGLDVRAERLGQTAASAQGKDGAGVQAVRLMVDTEKWYLSKLAPKRYGDRLDLNVDAKVEVRELTDDQLEGRIDGLFKKLYTGLVAGMQQQRQETADAD